MNKLDVSPHTLTLSPASHLDPSTHSPALPKEHRDDVACGTIVASGQCLNPVPRLIVLFPASETETPDLEHRIWEIARSLHLNVLLLSLTNDFDEEAQLRRKLITMAAIIKDPNVSTDIMIEHGNDWVRQVRKIWRAGDIVACYAGQKVGLMRKPLDQVLRSSLEATIYILSDVQPPRNPNSSFISRVLFWLGSLGIIGGFLWAEVNIVQLPQDWTHTVLIYVCIFVEVTILYLWNSLFT